MEYCPCQCEQQAVFKGAQFFAAAFCLILLALCDHCEMRQRNGNSLSARCKLFSECCGGRCCCAGVARLLGLASVCARTASLRVPVVPSISTQHRKLCVLACARDWSSVGGGLCTVSSVLDIYHLREPAFRIYLPRRPIRIKFMGARSCGVLLAGLPRAILFVHFASVALHNCQERKHEE